MQANEANDYQFIYPKLNVLGVGNKNNGDHKQAELTLYSNPHSRGNTVIWMLEECEANYDIQLLHFDLETKSKVYLDINPLGKVPALVHNEHVVTETGAICAYLAEIYAEKALKPLINNPKLADYYRWMFFLTGTFDAALIAKITNNLPVGKVAGMSSIGNFVDIEAVITLGVNQATPYLCGDQFTAADVVFASYLLFAGQTRALELSTDINTYLSLIMARPAFKRMMSFVKTHSLHFKNYMDL